MSYLYTGTNQAATTQTGLSTQILVVVDEQPIGAIQSLSVSQNRGLERIKEVGTDGTIEIVPNSAAEVSLQVTRIVFDKKRLTESFSRGYLNIHAQRIPFDIFVYDFQSARSSTEQSSDPGSGLALAPNLDANDAFDAPNDAEGVVTTVFENCWFSSLETTYNADNYIVSENASIECEWVHSFRDGQSNLPASLQVPSVDDALERLADVGRRGSLDARGLGRIGETFSGLLNP